MKPQSVVRNCLWLVTFSFGMQLSVRRGLAADKLIGFHSARTTRPPRSMRGRKRLNRRIWSTGDI